MALTDQFKSKKRNYIIVLFFILLFSLSLLAFDLFFLKNITRETVIIRKISYAPTSKVLHVWGQHPGVPKNIDKEWYNNILELNIDGKIVQAKVAYKQFLLFGTNESVKINYSVSRIRKKILVNKVSKIK